MRRTELRILDILRDGPLTVTRLAERLEKNQGWISELVADLEEQNLVEKDRRIELANTYEARLLQELSDTYDLSTILAGKKEEIFYSLLSEPKTVSELELEGFAKSTAYQALGDLQAVGAVGKSDNGEYRINDDTLRDFLQAREKTPENTRYEANGQVILKDDSAEGQPTAFSAFQRYGVDYYPSETYRYRGERELGMEDVLIHAVRFAENRKQMAICAVFYLTRGPSLDASRLWRLANQWDCTEKWADLLAFLDQRDIQQADLFFPWDEFIDLARDYNVYPRGKHPEDSLLTGLEELGATLESETEVYLLGGGNLILRGLKDSTKDIDVIVGEKRTLQSLVDALQQLGYQERRDLEEVYEQLDPGIVLEKEGFPRWDVFVETVANNLQLTEEMRSRVDDTQQFNDLVLHLLSLTDIFLFKAITDREGDLEDAALLVRQGDIDWNEVFEEIQTQEELTDRYFSFSVLDTLDLLVDRYDIEVPIHDRLVSYCLENALLVSLEEPKTIRNLRDELDFPDHRIYNKLRKLEESDRISVDRTGKLNRYELAADDSLNW